MPASEVPDAALVASARDGDSAALTALIARYSPKIMRFGMKMCRDEEDAREVMQDTWLAAARGVRDFRGQSSLSTWLYSIARSFCIKRRRRTVGEPEHLEALDELSEDRSPGLVAQQRPDDAAAAREIELALERAILALEPSYREVLLLRDVEGLSAAEVAEVVGVSVDAVKSRLHRARAAVRARLAPLLSDEPRALPEATCPDVIELLSRHVEDDVSPALCREMEAHVASCARCAARCDSLRKVLSLCEVSPLPRVAPEVEAQIRAEVQRVLNEPRGVVR